MVQQSFIGILMLDTAFPRLLGDVGNPQSYDMPVRMKTVSGAGSTDIVKADRPGREIVSAFLSAARALEAEGACGLISSCGFLVRLQKELSASVTIPVILSALSLGSLAECATGGRPCGILTADQDALDDHALAAAGLDRRRNPVVDMRHSDEFRAAILAPKDLQSNTIDTNAMTRDVITATRVLVAQHRGIGSIVLECGNLPPYKEAVQQVAGLPVFSIFDAAGLLWRSRVSARGQTRNVPQKVEIDVDAQSWFKTQMR